MDHASAFASIIALLLFLGAIALALGGTIFWIVAMIDAARREFTDPNMKVVWILIIFFTHFIGALIYFIVGRQQGRIPGQRL